MNTINRESNPAPTVVRAPAVPTPGDNGSRPSTPEGLPQPEPAGSGWGGSDRLRDLVETDVSEAEAEIRLLLLMLALFPLSARRRARAGEASEVGEGSVPLLTAGDSHAGKGKRDAVVQSEEDGSRAIAPAGTSSPVHRPRVGDAAEPEPRSPVGSRVSAEGSRTGSFRSLLSGGCGNSRLPARLRKSLPADPPATSRASEVLPFGGPRRKAGRQAAFPPAHEPVERVVQTGRPRQTHEHQPGMPERSWSAPLESAATALAPRLTGAPRADHPTTGARARVPSGMVEKARRARERIRPGIVAIAVLMILFVTCWPSVSAAIR